MGVIILVSKLKILEYTTETDTPANNDCTYVTTDHTAQVDGNAANDNVLEESFNGQQEYLNIYVY